MNKIKKMKENNKKILYVSDTKTIDIIRKKLSLNRFRYQFNDDSKLVSISFNIEQIKEQNYKIFSHFIDLLTFSKEIEELQIKILSFKIEKPQFLELLKKICSWKNLKSFKFSGENLFFPREIMGYFTKYMIISLRNLTFLELNFSLNKFGDDGITIFGLGLINLKFLITLKLNFSHNKIKGIGLIALITNIGTLKKLENLELLCEEINGDNKFFKENYFSSLKLLKKLITLKSIKLNFASNNLGPQVILNTIKLFLKNAYFDKLMHISLDLKLNCSPLQWQIYKNDTQKSPIKKIYDKYLESLDLNLSSNCIGDADFRIFYDILIFFKGMKNVNFNLSNNLFRQFRSNIFSIFGSFGQNLSLENVEIDLTKNYTIPFQNFSIGGDHIPNLENMKSLTIKSNLPQSFKISFVFAIFLKKFINLEKLILLIPDNETFENDQIFVIFESLILMKKLNYLDIEFTTLNMNEETFGKIINSLQNLKYLVKLRLAIRTDALCLRDNFFHLKTMLSFCQKIFYLTLSASKNDQLDRKFKVELKFLAQRLLDSHIFLQIEGFQQISSLFLKKKRVLCIARVLKKKLKYVYKRKLITSEILELF